MQIDITRIANGLIVEFKHDASLGNPLGGPPPRLPAGPLYAHDGTELMGFIAERIEAQYGFRNGGTE